MKKAIVSIIVGEKYQKLWEKLSYSGWNDYAKKHGYDLIIFNDVLDKSERAAKRSISWQRCLVLDSEVCQKYDRVVWLDSDIIINTSTAPCVVSQVPPEKIGGTDSYSFFDKNFYSFLYEKNIERWKEQNISAIINKIPQEFYSSYGLALDVDEVIQCGVLVLSPRYHNDLLRHVYYKYEDRGGSEWNYEMRPLSYEICKARLNYFIDTRFNLLANNFLTANYPYLLYSYPGLADRIVDKIYRLCNPEHQSFRFKTIMGLAMTTAFRNSFFLHFAGVPYLMEYANQKVVRDRDFGSMHL